ncbi:MAG TPA: hypothetical protein VNK26_02000 [Pyrinomonadaceae bacterium]|jgi:hypothetical protein|nr:hypothetical protein [Pyrinomonadaceae bacterium]
MQIIESEKLQAVGSRTFLVLPLIICSFFALAFLIALLPIELSIATVFLFAGPHNFLEFRYFLGHIPRKWGRSRQFYLIAISGVILLSALYFTAFYVFGDWLWMTGNASLILAIWNAGLLLWASILFAADGRLRRRDSDWIISLGLFAAAFAVLFPGEFSLALVYLHPLAAFWFLKRQIRQTGKQWLKHFNYALAACGVSVFLLIVLLLSTENLTSRDDLSLRIIRHAGSDILPQISSRLLVSVHVFLETLHYSVWLVFLPLIDPRLSGLKLSNIPLAMPGAISKNFIFAAIGLSFAIVLLLWVGFILDYQSMRDLYFAAAIAHVLAEIPFLIRLRS